MVEKNVGCDHITCRCGMSVDHFVFVGALLTFDPKKGISAIDVGRISQGEWDNIPVLDNDSILRPFRVRSTWSLLLYEVAHFVGLARRKRGGPVKKERMNVCACLFPK